GGSWREAESPVGCSHIRRDMNDAPAAHRPAVTFEELQRFDRTETPARERLTHDRQPPCQQRDGGVGDPPAAPLVDPVALPGVEPDDGVIGHIQRVSRGLQGKEIAAFDSLEERDGYTISYHSRHLQVYSGARRL